MKLIVSLLLSYCFLVPSWALQNGISNQNAPWVGLMRSGGAVGAAFISAFTPASTRFDSFEAGFLMVVGATPLTADALGRYALSGNSLSHTVSIYSAPLSGSPVLVVSVVVSMAGATPSTFKYGPATANLAALTQYAVVVTEQGGTEEWCDDNGSITTIAGATITNSCFRASGSTGAFSAGASGVRSYSAPNFKFY